MGGTVKVLYIYILYIFVFLSAVVPWIMCEMYPNSPNHLHQTQIC